MQALQTEFVLTYLLYLHINNYYIKKYNTKCKQSHEIKTYV